MPPRKRTVPDPSEAMTVGTREQIRERLAQFVDRKFDGNWSHFARVLGVPEATAEEWKRAKKGAPRLDHLIRFAEHRLSLDWLFRGEGEMEWETLEPKTDSGTLILMLRPVLAKLSGAGEMAADEAFSHLLLGRSNRELLELAAGGLLPLYRQALGQIAQRDEATRVWGYVLERLALLEVAAERRGDSEVTVAARELREALTKISPGPAPNAARTVV